MKPVHGIAAALMLCGVMIAPSAFAASAVGIWTTDGGKSQVKIAPCGAALCGRIVWLKKPYDKNGKPALDTHNPVKADRTHPILGLQIVSGMRPEAGEPNAWSGGRVYDPDSGNTYKAEMHLDGAGTLKLRGYIGIPLFGRSTTWTRSAKVNAEQPPPVKR